MTAQNIPAEQAVLGAALYAKEAFTIAASVVRADDFYRPGHGLIWEVIEHLIKTEMIADPVLVLAELDARGMTTKVGGAPYLHTLYAAAAIDGAVRPLAQIVADAATLRRVETAGRRMAQRADEGTVGPAELVAWAGEQLAAARDERQGVDVLTKSYEDFVHSMPEEREMVIPGLLGQGDRLVLTGQGGIGKSAMLQQIAVCAAAGLQPFDWHSEDAYEPQRVAILDFENPDHRVKTRLWPLVNDCARLGTDPRPNLTIGGGGNPLNLLNPQNALSLLRTIEHDKPTLLYIGPVYKMHNDDPDKETVVKKITDTLDSIRAMGVAVITEAHHTKEGRKGGTLEPSGSNLWTWWPEFGLGLRLDEQGNDAMRACRLERWRIDREASYWPSDVESSGQMGLKWARRAAPGWRGEAA